MQHRDSYFATLKASCFAASQRSVAKINEYWRQHGIDARAEIAPDGSISSRINVRKHCPVFSENSSRHGSSGGGRTGAADAHLRLPHSLGANSGGAR